MRISHLIVTHKNPNQLSRLIKALSHPDADIYIHLDKKVNIEHFLKVNQYENIYFIKNRTKVQWGAYSFLKAIINSIKEIKDTGQYYDFINLISGQDYPIKNINRFISFLKQNKGKCYISYEDDELMEWWKENIVRVNRYHFNDFSIRGRFRLQWLVNKILPLRKFPKDWKLYGGSCSSWWTLPSEAAYYFVETMENNAALRRYVRLTWTPDEYIYATILMNSKFKESVVNNNFRYIDWSEKKPNPKILVTQDFEKFSKTENFFARKFDSAIDDDVIDLIDDSHKNRTKSSLNY